MTIEVTAAVLLAALLHAGWNALIKIRGDRLLVMALMTLCGSLVSLPLVPIVGIPDPASWHLLALTIVLHTCYHVFLPIAYDHGDLGQVYPIARGSAPLLVTIGAVVLAGERLEPLALLGVVCLGAGVMALAFDRRTGVARKPKAVLYALLTAIAIASYTLVDGLGARQAGSPLAFAIWLTIGDGILTFGLVLLIRRGAVWAVARENLPAGFLGGLMQAMAYWIIVWALAQAPMALVSALRETSVLFAAVISAFVLKEGFGVWRFVSAAMVTLGLVLTRAQK